MKPSKISFIFLCIAFIISASYQAYISTIREVPAYDQFGIKEIGLYLLMMGISCIVLVNKKWAYLFIIGFCVLLCGIAFGFYIPVVMRQRTLDWIDIGEAVVYLGCILVAAIFALKAVFQRN